MSKKSNIYQLKVADGLNVVVVLKNKYLKKKFSYDFDTYEK